MIRIDIREEVLFPGQNQAKLSNLVNQGQGFMMYTPAFLIAPAPV
jgi:hypothetical protein